MNRVASVIKLDYARKQGLTGKNVGIAVMDTGIKIGRASCRERV